MNAGRQLPPDNDRPLISRTTIVILASVLIGMGFGSRLPQHSSQICLVFGALGLFIYVTLEVLAHWRIERRQYRRQQSAEKVLETRIREFQNRMQPVSTA